MKQRKPLWRIIICVIGLITAGCATTGEQAENEESRPPAPDPIEPINRKIFAFNDRAYQYVFSPIATGYTTIMPDPLEGGIRNFFRNLKFPVRFTNSLLQGKGKRAGIEVQHFFLNTTVGFLGFAHVSEDIAGDAPPEEDLGQTLGVWGFGNGPYLVMPLMGPTTLRDGVGRFGDHYAEPLTYVDNWKVEWGTTGIEFLNDLPVWMNRYEQMKRDAFDPYISLRNAYLANRKREVER